MGHWLFFLRGWRWMPANSGSQRLQKLLDSTQTTPHWSEIPKFIPGVSSHFWGRRIPKWRTYTSNRLFHFFSPSLVTDLLHHPNPDLDRSGTWQHLRQLGTWMLPWDKSLSRRHSHNTGGKRGDQFTTVDQFNDGPRMNLSMNGSYGETSLYFRDTCWLVIFGDIPPQKKQLKFPLKGVALNTGYRLWYMTWHTIF